MSSKLRKLKQQAYEAGKKRDWNAAMDAYAHIVDLDHNNPSLLNEFGDVCLKAGETARAIRQFLAAASKYRGTGLLNNAQAVYKKVLRHDGENINANWYLAEIRAAQGLRAEGELHTMRFLAAADEASGDFGEIFVKRCQELLGLYPDSPAILEKLAEVFRLRNMTLESGRADCLRACTLHQAGEEQAAEELVAACLGRSPELRNYGEYTRWREALGELAVSADPVEVNPIDLDAPSSPEPDPAVDADEAPAPDEPDHDDQPVDETSFADVDLADAPSGAPAAVEEPPMAAPAPPETPERDDEGCITIDCGESASFADLMDDLTSLANGDQAAEDAPEPAAAVGGDSAPGVNLLDEILAEEGEDILRSNDTEQVSTIASEVGRNLGDQEQEDPEAQYQQGLVYYELGLFDQAALALEVAARSESVALRARELWGIVLMRAGRPDEALQVLEDGLVGCDPAHREALGLRYHAGCVLQELGRSAAAHEYYRQVYEVDAGFADVARRLRAPVS